MAPLKMFTGLSAFPITPSDEDGQVDTKLLNGLLSRLADAKVDSVGLLGSTGSYPFLTRAERLRAIEAAKEQLGNHLPIIVGVGALRTDDAAANAKDAAKADASGLLLAPVSYTPLTDEEVFQHFAAVAAATDLPICIYNNPASTHFNFSLDLLERISAIETVKTVKNPAPPRAEAAETLAELRNRLPDDFAIGFSGDWNAPNALLEGADAWYSVIGGLLPVPALALTRAAQAKDHNRFEQLDTMFQPLWDLFQELTGLRVTYAAANIMGLTNTQAPRPILPLSKSDYERIEIAIEPLVNFTPAS